ncbi:MULTISPECIES: hypothetical protein [Streptomycetaceae]|nr:MULTISPECIES: hypothetical protein [Streptomycetaceae]MYS57306.1 hypothetical protein [Streptomyces sp. SID5468]
MTKTVQSRRISLPVSAVSPSVAGCSVCSLAATMASRAWVSTAKQCPALPGSPAPNLVFVEPGQPLRDLRGGTISGEQQRWNAGSSARRWDQVAVQGPVVPALPLGS